MPKKIYEVELSASERDHLERVRKGHNRAKRRVMTSDMVA